MAVNDHGIEALKKAAEEVIAGSLADYFLKVGGVPGRRDAPIPVAPVDPEIFSPVAISPSGAIETAELIRLVGGNFETGSLNPNVWATNLVNGGTVTAIEGEAVLATNTTADGQAEMESQKRARFITATFNKAHLAVQLLNFSNTDVIRDWGLIDPINTLFSGDGVFFRNNSGVITINRRKSGVIVETVALADFNGNPVSLTDPTIFIQDENVHIYEIVYNAGSALFYQNRRLVHRMTFLDAVGYETVHLCIAARVENINGNTVANTLKTRGFSCSRIGTLAARPDFVTINVSAASPGTTIKNSPGTLRRIVITRTGTGGASLVLFDGLDDTASTQFMDLELTSQLVPLEFGLDFNRGLTFTATGNNFEVLVIYD